MGKKVAKDQGCKNAVALSRRSVKTWSVRTFIFLRFYFKLMNAAWQSLYKCSAKNFWALIAFIENCTPAIYQSNIAYY